MPMISYRRESSKKVIIARLKQNRRLSNYSELESMDTVSLLVSPLGSLPKTWVELVVG